MKADPDVVAIIQARMGSSRLPGKVLSDIAGRPMLWHVVQRVRRAKSVDRLVVATSSAMTDDAVAEFCDLEQIPLFRGSEKDVLDRYFRCAHHTKAKTIVRITGDCPLTDPEVVDQVVDKYRRGQYDYVTNIFPRSFPEGLDVEVFSLAVLERLQREALDAYDREHVTPYVQRNPVQFRIGNVLHSKDLSTLHWSVDFPQDMEFVRSVYHRMTVSPFGMGEVLKLLKEYPELMPAPEGR